MSESERIQFRSVSRQSTPNQPETPPPEPSSTSEPPPPPPPPPPELELEPEPLPESEPLSVRLASEGEALRAIFEFLASLYAGQPAARRALVVEAALWQRLCGAPHAEWRRALSYCVDASLLQIGPDVSCWGALSVPAAIWPLIWLLHNGLVPARGENGAEVVQGSYQAFNEALLEMIPPARTLPDMLLYHGILHHAVPSLPHVQGSLVPLLQALLTRSPLTALYCLDWHTPPALTPLAAQLLPGGKHYVPLQSCLPWSSGEEWLDAVALLLAEPRVARFLHQRWLTLPEKPAACRNVGLLLEALRRRGGQRAFLLDFYEMYDYSFRSQGWPLLAEIERLLRVGPRDYDHPGYNDKVVLGFNRGGNERFLKFWPLYQLVKAEGDIVPRDYKHLSREFYLALEELVRWASVKGG